MMKAFVFALVLVPVLASEDLGWFWHVTDMHWDPTRTSSHPGLSCGNGARNGTFGDYLCDSPWRLIESGVVAMTTIRADVDFLIWTGDDTPHIYDDNLLNKTAVNTIIKNLTDLLIENFPNKTVFSALGNHDWSPKHLLPPNLDPTYATYSRYWAPWMSEEANTTFQQGGYYTMKPWNTSEFRVVVLNTNLYYTSNRLSLDKPDPASQMRWLDDVLTQAATDKEKVILIAHIPPGKFEKHREKIWYQEHYNLLLTALLVKHRGVLSAMHMGHHHTDTFRLVRDHTGAVVSHILIAPSITPWATTLPGVQGGAANNPGVRLVQYDRRTGHTKHVLQYYLNLTLANANRNASWSLLYNFTKYYGLSDMTSSSMAKLADDLGRNEALFQKYYRANGVYYEPNSRCVDKCAIYQLCAIHYLDYANHTACVQDEEKKLNSAARITNTFTVTMVTAAITYFLM